MKNLKIVAALSLSLVILIGCAKKEDNKQKNSEAAIPVEVSVVKKSNIQRDIELVGTLAAWKEANLGAQTTARIQKIYVEEGSRVKEGDLLFEMDDTQLAQAKIQYQVAKDNYDRLKPLYETGSISQSQFDQVKAAYETAEKSYKLLLTNTQFRAPFNGVITAKKLNEGEVFLLAPGGAGAPTVVSLMQINPLKLLVNVSEINFRDVRLNQTVEVKSSLYPNEVFKGTISRINPTINTATRTFEVEVKIPNPNEKLRPGMYVTAKINLGQVPALVVERDAILKQLGVYAYYAFVADGNTAKRRTVKIGQEFNDKIEVIEGLKEGDNLIIKGQVRVKDGSTIDIKSKGE